MEWLEHCKTFIPKIKAQYRQRVGKELNLENPQTLTEKIQWLKVYDSSFLKTFCADKITLHDYCIEKLGKDICIPIIATYKKPEQIDWKKLPNQFVIKCNHGSGYNIIVKDKSKLNKEEAIQKLRKWLAEDYGLLGYELHYCNVPRKILIEEYKETKGQNDLTDYKLFCFNKEPKFWQIITDRRTNEKISHFDMNWNYAPQFDWARYNSRSDIKKPDHYEEMIEYAKKLCEDFSFVRVDFYVIDNKVYLGEITFTPADGFQIFRNSNCDYVLGKFLAL